MTMDTAPDFPPLPDALIGPWPDEDDESWDDPEPLPPVCETDE